MHVQGNYNNQVGQDLNTSRPVFQQPPPPPPPPPPPQHGPFAPQPQDIQHGHPSFHPTPGSFANRHALPSFLHQGPPGPVVSSRMSSAESYLSHTQPTHIRNQMSHPYPTSEQRVPWSQNVHQLPPTAAPLLGPNAYPLPSPQRQTLGNGQSNQYPSHGPLPGPPPLPPYSSSSNSALRQHSYLQPMGPPPLPPPPPPSASPPPPPPSAPPLPSSSPPRVPPLPSSSPPSDVPPKNGGSLSSEDFLDVDNSMLEHSPPDKPEEDRNVHQNEVPCHHTENNGPKMESTDAIVAYSPAGSDMEMEDDITHPDDEKKDQLSTISVGGCTSISQEDFVKEQLQALQYTGEYRVSKDAVPENFLFGEASVLMDQRRGSEVVSLCDFPVTRKVSSEADESGMTKNRRTEQPLLACVNESSPLHKNSSEPSVPVVCEETGHEELPDEQHMEGVNSFNLLQGYASDNISENEGENRLGDVSFPALNGGSTKSDARKECNIGSNTRVECLSESNLPVLPQTLIESPRNVMEANKLSLANGILEEYSDKSHRGQESVTTSAALQSKDPSKCHGACIGLESAKFDNQDMKSNSPEMKVDEFGRLAREGVSDSDTSDSPRYTRRHARRTRKRSSSRSRSRSPIDRRRRRSPRRRKGRRVRSPSLSPKRRRSRSKSPVLRRDSEFSGDKRRGENSQLQQCFDFLRGKCYRGSTCRYSHHESVKSEILRYNRGKQQFTFRSPRVHEEGKVLYDKEVTDKELPQDTASLRKEVRDVKELLVDPSTHSPDKLDSLVSGFLPFADVVTSNPSSHGMPSGKENDLILESPAQYSDKVPQIVDQQGQMMDDSLVSESSSLMQASSAHLTADKPDAKEGHTSQLLSVESPIMKSYSTEEVQVTLPLPSVSLVMTAPLGQDYNSIPPIAGSHLTPKNHSLYQAPVAYQHPRFPGLSNSSASLYLPPPPPLPPPPHLSVNTTLGEHGNPSQHTQQPLQPSRDGLPSYTSIRAHPTELHNQSQTYQCRAYQLPREPDQMLHITENSASSSAPRIIGERVTGHPVQGMNPLQSFSQAQSYSLRANSPSKATHISLGGGLPSDSNFSHDQPYFQQASYRLQYSSGGVPVQFSQPEKGSSSMSRLTPDFLEKYQPSYAHNFMGSRISSHFNPYASTFDKPLNSKFKFNASIQENDTTINTIFAAHNVASVVSKNMNSSSSFGLPAQSVLARAGGDQYDPLLDSIEPASTSFNRAAHENHEIPGDSDNMPIFNRSGMVLDMEIIKQEEGPALSANDSIENEEFGETAEAEVGDVSNGSPCTTNDATDMNRGEIEIDEVKASRKKRKGTDSPSMKLFKISIASFVKDVLKPSWRQGNMSKEAFKTIVKKTVDKVSVAMKGHRVPKSRSKINHYIDSSRGKLTKLVMGYVDKYVKI